MCNTNILRSVLERRLLEQDASNSARDNSDSELEVMEVVQEPFEEHFIPEGDAGDSLVNLELVEEQRDCLLEEDEIAECSAMESNDLHTEPFEVLSIDELDAEERPIKMEPDENFLEDSQSSGDTGSNHPAEADENYVSSILRCDECGIVYSHAEMLFWHVENCHGNEPTVRILRDGPKRCGFQCIQCNKTHGDIYYIIKHLSVEHKLQNLPFRCNICNEQFMQIRQLRRHQLKCGNDEISEAGAGNPEPKEDSVLEQHSRDETASTSEKKTAKNMTCFTCDITYTHPEMLSWHTEHFHGPNPTVRIFKIDDKRSGFQCIECKQRFQNFYPIIRHLRNEHQLENLPFPCTICNSQFIDKFKLRKHKLRCKVKKKTVKKVTLSNIPRCDQCDSTYSHPEMLTWHVENCHGDDPIVRILKDGDKKCGFQCVECDLEHRDIYVIIRHLVTEHQLVNLPFQCSVCKKQFLEHHNMKQHQLKCNVASSLKCVECDILYFHNDMYTWHMANCHGENAIVNVLKLDDRRRQFQCIECGTENRDIYVLIKHLKDQHQLENLPFSCYMCKKQFMENHVLKQHELKCNTAVDKFVSPSSSLKCDICDILYFHHQMLNWHMENCHGDDPIVKIGDKKSGFQCVECGMENRDIYVVIRHLVAEHQLVNLPFACDSCDEKFVENRQLKSHQTKCRKMEKHEEILNIKTEPQDENEMEDFVPDSPEQSTEEPSIDPNAYDERFKKHMKCSECNSSYSNSEMLNWHIEHCHGPNPSIQVTVLKNKKYNFQCVKCKENFRDFHLIIQHLRTKHNLTKMPFQCKTCSRQFGSRGKMVVHQPKCKSMVNNPMSKPVQYCKQCGIAYRHPQVLAWHHKFCHGPNAIVKIIKTGPKQCVFQCVKCTKKFIALDFIIRHLRNTHQHKKLPFQCNICNKQFVKLCPLKQHKIYCTKVIEKKLKVHRCELCDISYGYVEMLAWHNENCHGENPTMSVIKNTGSKKSVFQCIECGAKFKDTKFIIQHLHSDHQLEKLPFQCSLCMHYFARVDNFQSHKETCKITKIRFNFGRNKNTVQQKEMEIDEEEDSNDPPETNEDLFSMPGTSRDVPRPATIKNHSLKCKECEMVYTYPEMLSWHIENSHGSNPTVKLIKSDGKGHIYQCAFCDFQSTIISTVIQHLHTEHALNKLPFQCNVCHRGYVRKCDAVRHEAYCKNTPKHDLMDFEEVFIPSIETPPIQPGRDSLREHHHAPSKEVNKSLLRDGELPKCQVLVVKLLECDSCSFYTEKNSELDSHMQVCHQAPSTSGFRKQPGNFKTSVVLKCDECGLGYPHPELLKWHTDHCHGGNPTVQVKLIDNRHFYQCVRCKNIYNKIQAIVRHLQRRHQLVNLPFHCNVCDKQFIYWCEFNSHQMECKVRQNVNRSASIVDRSVTTVNRSTRTDDESDSSDSRSVSSVDENASCVSRSVSTVSRSVSTVNRSVSTGIVNGSFGNVKKSGSIVNRSVSIANRNASTVNRSVSRSASPAVNLEQQMIPVLTSIKCDMCRSHFRSEKYLKKHILNFHSPQKGKYFNCGHCTDSFPSFSTLKSHCYRIHPGKNVLTCNVCQKEYDRFSSYYRHVRFTHSGFVFTCEVCSTTFSYSDNLKRHMRDVHSLQHQLYACMFCGEKLDNQKCLHRHFRAQHSDSVFRCDFCDFCSVKKRNLITHMKSKHSIIGFKCQ